MSDKISGKLHTMGFTVAMETAKTLNNNLLRLRNFKMAAVAMEIIFEFTA
jgi:hypothetical protein